MNKKLTISLVLASILFVSCKKDETVTPEAIKSVESKTSTSIVATTQRSSTNETGKFVEKPEIKKQGLIHIKSFMEGLKGTLHSTLQADPTHMVAINACSSMAIKMTDEYNQNLTRAKVRRTALKYRNPANKPDATDRFVMNKISNTSFSPVVVELSDHYRVYKPLVMKKPCLICHASTSKMSPAVVKNIQKTYPADMATGFIEGEFRGTVVVEIKK